MTPSCSTDLHWCLRKTCDAGKENELLNKKLENELQIKKLSLLSGPVTGGDEIFILTNKIKTGLLLCSIWPLHYYLSRLLL